MERFKPEMKMKFIITIVAYYTSSIQLVIKTILLHSSSLVARAN